MSGKNVEITTEKNRSKQVEVGEDNNSDNIDVFDADNNDGERCKNY